MTSRVPFMPSFTQGQTVTPAAAAAAVTIRAEDDQVCLTNLGANVCYVRLTDSSSTANASTADYPVPPGAQVVITKGETISRLSHISAAGTTLHIITGNGW